MTITDVSARRRHTKGAPKSTGGQFMEEAKGESVGGLVGEAISAALPETVYTKRYDSMEDKLAAIKGELDQQVADLATDANWLNYLETASKFHRYSFSNQLLIQLQLPGATRVAGFKKWKEFDRSVIKGQKSISILAPKRIMVIAKDKAGNPILKDGKPFKESRVVGFTTASVFDMSQTEGTPLPDIERSLSEEPPDGFREDLETAIRAAGFTVDYEDIPGGAEGFTKTDGSKRIVIQKGLTPGSEVQVLAHELGHVMAGHIDKKDDYHEGHDGHRHNFEVEAESIAYVMLRSNGMSPAVGKTSSTYVAGWARRDPEAIKESGENVSKAVKKILESSPWRNVEDRI